MATVTGLTAERMLAIEAESIVDGDISGDNLILTRHDGVQINAGNVRGPAGPVGPIGSDLSVLAAATVLDVGQLNQIRAGRQFAAVDFTNMGLSAPVGLWNLSDLSDASGNGRALSNKGAVPFVSGINGVATTAARFSGSTAQVLYIADSGAADPFRIKTGSMGLWFRTAKRATAQLMMSKWEVASSQAGYVLYIGAANAVVFDYGIAGPGIAGPIGLTDVCDDRWHFAVITFDGGMIRLYVDGHLEQQVVAVGTLFGSNIPFNIGGAAGNAATASQNPFFGRIDEAFVLTDVLSEEQIRNLYCAKISHALGVRPTRASINVVRRRRGAALVAGDFPVQPLRLHNFSAASLGDAGSNNVALTNNGTAVPVPGADGTKDNAFGFAGAQSLSSTDAGLPSALASRSYGCWFKSSASTVQGAILSWGTQATNDAKVLLDTSGRIDNASGGDTLIGPFAADGHWHFVVAVEDNAPAEGLKRKLYVDGKLVAATTVLTSLTLAGANRFRVGANPDGTFPFVGQIDAAFVTDQVLTAEQIRALYDKSAQALPQSPKNTGDHVESLASTELLATFDTLETNAQVDLGVAA